MGQNCTRQWFRRQLPGHCEFNLPRKDVLAQIKPIAESLRELEKRHPNMHVFDGVPVLCPPNQKACTNYTNGLRTYIDYSHLTKAGSHLFSDAFDAFLRDHSLLIPQPAKGTS
ncbi:MAG: SGNH hydrolase domain-containing protein [Cyanobacteriota bacterium]|nr:SGNH hydrolase domain-containing protein [Cyanobacteriota bacterium]